MARRDKFNPALAVAGLALDLVRQAFPRATNPAAAFLVLVVLPVGAGAGVAVAEPHALKVYKGAKVYYNLAIGKPLAEINR